jgi:SAM-dependent methyltransferase
MVKQRLKKGIPVFSQDDYWGEITEEKMKKYLALVEEKGFSAFQRKVLADDKKFYDFIFSDIRADWRFCLPTERHWRVLDIGAGLGANSFALAKEVEEVTSVERSFLRAKFLKLRKEHEGRKNINIMSADALDLPFGSESFDLIVANGLFEWLGVTNKFSSPQDAQKRFLKEAMRILRKGGYLYIGIENRFAANYLLGGGKDHNGLRFTSWMPRFLANFYTRLRTGKKYQTYTYSKLGYEKILKQAGFKNIDFYLTLPGYNFPKYIIPYECLSGLRFITTNVLGGLTRKRKLLKKIISLPLVARTWRLLFFSFAIFGQKS